MGNNQQTLDDQPMGSGKHPGLDCSINVGTPFVCMRVKSRVPRSTTRGAGGRAPTPAPLVNDLGTLSKVQVASI